MRRVIEVEIDDTGLDEEAEVELRLRLDAEARRVANTLRRTPGEHNIAHQWAQEDGTQWCTTTPGPQLWIRGHDGLWRYVSHGGPVTEELVRLVEADSPKPEGGEDEDA